MKRSAFRPQLNPVEQRLLAAVSPMALTHQQHTESAPQAHAAWAVTSLENQTKRDVTFRIFEQVGSKELSRAGILVPNEKVHFVHLVPRGGTIPIYHVNFSYPLIGIETGRGYGERPVPPFVFDHEPTEKELDAHPTTYEFRNRFPTTHIELMNPDFSYQNLPKWVYYVRW